MSEEILNALMQLFAIIAKQDDGATEIHKAYVNAFLKSQLSTEKVDDYLVLYDQFLAIKSESKKRIIEEEEPVKRTSVRDSVKIMGICTKINKTLTHKQKIVVLVRIIELINKEGKFTRSRSELIETVSLAFNISEEESFLFKNFITKKDTNNENYLIINSDEKVSQSGTDKNIFIEGLDGHISIIKSFSTDLYFLKYIGHNILSLNSSVIDNHSVYIFPPGSSLRLPKGAVYYSDIVSKFLTNNEKSSIDFSVNDLEYTFKNGKRGIHPLSINENSGKLISIMGASGSGKTTLLNLLCGIEKPTKGSVEINGINIHENADQIKGLIGYITQDDLLIEELTVFENLFYYAKLCFGNLSDKEIKEKAETTLTNLGLIEVKDIKVGSPLKKRISGGQRKRLNIALEIIREPSILFVDEPTSGLSSADSENVIDLLKELSLKGKLVFVVIHQPSSDIYKLFDKLILLDVGGYIIYYGNPVDAITYFKKHTQQVKSDIAECYICGNVNSELLFSLVESKEVNEFGQAQRKRRIKPVEWYQLYIKSTIAQKNNNQGALPKIISTIPGKIKQLITFAKRDIKSKLSNKQYLLINLIEAPLLAFILATIIKYASDPETGKYQFSQNENLPAYIFVSIIIALFIGLTVSAEEIFKDKKLLKQQHFLNLSKGSYLFSKIAILFFISAIQMLLFVLVGNTIVKIPNMYFDYWILLFSVSCAANIMGLIISASFNSIISIYILIPLLIIPQLILGGAMFSFDKINDIVGGGAGKKTPIIAEIMFSRWAYEAMAVHQYKANAFEAKFFEIDKMQSISNYKQVYYFPKLDEVLNQCIEVAEDSLHKNANK